MHQATNRQQIFVSSTINDFKDLRGAIKYWLEELGLIVYMSEFTNFPRKVNEDTYQSCFGVIPLCDYFVLIIGGRRGSWYREGEVSVTQQEFRMAAELARQGKTNLIILAREDVRRTLKGQKALGEPLGRDPLEIDNVWIQDPAFTDQFLDEIKNTQVKDQGNDPSGQMWVYYFGDFRDVAEVLRSNLRFFGSVPRQTLLANLRWELVDNISSMSTKEDGLPRPGYWFVEDVRRDVKLDPSPPIRAIPLSVEQASELVWFVVTGMPGVGRLRMVALGDAIRSREFLFFNQVTQHLEPSKPLEVMYRLLGQIEEL